ncbi:predicted protein [Botrytis cinerea T4]|uniref:Uncharacterized protein n=1 Tax=Botryotinia fuckeliana (strain T4) TaxID=999810 RepID=G2YR35_BOTF4|nr:predicted protein [Botrytis cinerea T4]
MICVCVCVYRTCRRVVDTRAGSGSHHNHRRNGSKNKIAFAYTSATQGRQLGYISISFHESAYTNLYPAYLNHPSVD